VQLLIAATNTYACKALVVWQIDASRCRHQDFQPSRVAGNTHCKHNAAFTSKMGPSPPWLKVLNQRSLLLLFSGSPNILTSTRVGCHGAHAAASCCCSMTGSVTPGSPPTKSTRLLGLTALCLGGGGAAAAAASAGCTAAAWMPDGRCARCLNSCKQYLGVALVGHSNGCLLSNIASVLVGLAAAPAWHQQLMDCMVCLTVHLAAAPSLSVEKASMLSLSV
jgi:hypothetical protein